MKNEPSHSQSPNNPAPVRHQYEHLTPTVIQHDPEEDMVLLARWAHRALKNPTKFWSWVGVGLVTILGLVILISSLSSRSGTGSDVWTRLDAAKNADDQIQVAKEFAGKPAASWALLQAATRLYTTGIDDLPKNRDAALLNLKKAIDLFEQIDKEAPKDSPLALTAALGKARALEARNELPKAIDQYKLVADAWPGTPEAAEAKQIASALQKPDAAAFYKELYAFTPVQVTLPPLGTENLEFPPTTDSPAAVPAAPGDSPLLIPPPPPTSNDAAPAKSEEAKPEPAPADAPKVEEPKAAEETPAPADAPKVEEPKAAEPSAPAPAEPKAEADTPKS